MKKKRLSVILGNRPQFIKHAPLDPLLRKKFTLRLIHTGQHYDWLMSDVFFKEFSLPEPDINLGVGSGTHAFQTARMLEGLEADFLKHRPDMVLVYGDTNSTLAGALAAVKLKIPVCHVEAGPRLYNDLGSPEEINRITADHLSKLRLAPTKLAAANLAREGIKKGVHVVGDLMYDIFLTVSKKIEPSDILKKYSLEKNSFVYVTLHRPENVDDPKTLGKILKTFGKCGMRLVYPVHPRTRAAIKKFGFEELVTRTKNLLLIDPVGYNDSVALLLSCERVLTDSGGLQKEAYFAAKPCITMMDISPWPETIKAGWNYEAGPEPEKIIYGLKHFTPATSRPKIFGNGDSAHKIIEAIENFFS